MIAVVEVVVVVVNDTLNNHCIVLQTRLPVKLNDRIISWGLIPLTVFLAFSCPSSCRHRHAFSQQERYTPEKRVCQTQQYVTCFLQLQPLQCQHLCLRSQKESWHSAQSVCLVNNDSFIEWNKCYQVLTDVSNPVTSTAANFGSLQELPGLLFFNRKQNSTKYWHLNLSFSLTQ